MVAGERTGGQLGGTGNGDKWGIGGGVGEGGRWKNSQGGNSRGQVGGTVGGTGGETGGWGAGRAGGTGKADRWGGGVDRTVGVMVRVLRVESQHYTCS